MNAPLTVGPIVVAAWSDDDCPIEHGFVCPFAAWDHADSLAAHPAITAVMLDLGGDDVFFGSDVVGWQLFDRSRDDDPTEPF